MYVAIGYVVRAVCKCNMYINSNINGNSYTNNIRGPAIKFIDTNRLC